MKGAKLHFVHCADCNLEQDHPAFIDDNDETLVQCPTCSRFLKFPKGSSRLDVIRMLKLHKEANTRTLISDN